MPRHEFTVTATEHGQRIDAVLAALPGIPSRSAAAHLVEQGGVAVNGTTCTTKKRVVCTGDAITYQTATQTPPQLISEPMDLDIRYEDADLIVLSKPAGLVVHPAPGHPAGTLVNGLIAHCGYSNLAQIQGEMRPGIVHRLDKDTSGLMLVAKSDVAAERLKADIQTRAVDRRYLTLVHGSIAPNTGLIDAPIGRAGNDRMKRAVSEAPDARQAVTTFTVLERFEAGRNDDGYTLVECKLYTGRTHQIRVHMHYIEHPVVGDPMYGANKMKPQAQLGLSRQFLHSWRLALQHPVTEEPLSFEDALPEDLQEVLTALADRSMGQTEAAQALANRYLQ
jgi:23S rRNA pseudouridine1911/1915/1917 synthase